MVLTTPVRLTLEQAIAYVEDDELVEVTPRHIRLRKRYLDPHERKRQSRHARPAEPSLFAHSAICILRMILHFTAGLCSRLRRRRGRAHPLIVLVRLGQSG